MPEDYSAIQFFKTKTLAKQATTVVGAATMVANLAMSVSLQLHWALLNVMQLLLIMPLINVNFPVNAATFYGYLIDIANFDILPIESINQAIYKFSDNEVEMPSNFEELGYETTIFINNLGSMLFFIKGFIIMSFLTLMLGLCKNWFSFVEKIQKWLASFLFYNFILRLILESYLEITISSILNI
jgi:hypothetical protein